METKIRRVISQRELLARVPLGRTSIWKKGRDPNDPFPAAVALTDNKIGWYEEEIEAWLASRPRLVSGVEAA